MTNAAHEHDPLTDEVLGAVFEVSNTLGAGFLEKVYQRALIHELQLRGIRAAAEVSISVTYKGRDLGVYFADIVVEGELVVELKCSDRLSNEHTAQCLNYLRASGRTVCLLVNFQRPRVEWRRIVFGFAEKAIRPPMDTDGRRRTPIKPYSSWVCRGSVLYFGGRWDLGTMVTPALTRPTRSRAIARTSLVALNTFFFFAAIRPLPGIRLLVRRVDRTLLLRRAWDRT